MKEKGTKLSVRIETLEKINRLLKTFSKSKDDWRKTEKHSSFDVMYKSETCNWYHRVFFLRETKTSTLLSTITR